MPVEYLNNARFEKTIKKYQNSKRSEAKCMLIIEDLQGTIDRKKSRNVNCCQQKEMLEDQKNHLNQARLDFEEAESQLATDFFSLSERLAKYYNYQRIEIDDAIQEGVVICFDKIERFVPGRGKAFNYMTTCISNHFKQLHRTSKNYSDLKDKYREYQMVKSDKTIIKNGKESPYYRSDIF
jgi:DNA-directed RNA polymerase specialized sigma subunit